MAKTSNQLRPNVPAADQLICPGCGERLTPADVENFPACPYCDFAFRRDSRLEDFALLPVISRWESGRVSPNAENLAKLKELLG